METKKMKTLDMVYIALFACLMAICAWISIPGQIPFTLQTMGVFLAIGLLGGKRGTIAVLVYILMGAVGLPVFSGFAGGLGKLLGMTGGYIVGFLVSALLMWAMEALFGSKKWVLPVSMVVGLIACYAFGSAWFYFFYAANGEVKSVWGILLSCVIPYLLPDAAKAALSQLIVRRCGKYIKK